MNSPSDRMKLVLSIVFKKIKQEVSIPKADSERISNRNKKHKRILELMIIFNKMIVKNKLKALINSSMEQQIVINQQVILKDLLRGGFRKGWLPILIKVN